MKAKHTSLALALPAPASTDEVSEAAAHEEAGWDKVRKLALRRMDRMMSLEPKVLRGNEPEAVHKFRVASRRAQQVLDLLFPSPRPPEIRRLRRRIRRCRKVFSDVRNCDVLMDRVERQLAANKPAQREAWEALFAYVRERRHKAHLRALRKLSKLNLAEVYVRLGTTFRQMPPPEGCENSPHESHPTGARRSLLQKRLGEELEKVWQVFASRCAESQSTGDGQAIHAARIAAKKLRYLAELIGKLNVEGSRDGVAWLRSLQDIFGDWHDLETAEQMMAEMIASSQFLRQNPGLATGILKLMGRNRKAKDRLQKNYPKASLDSPGGKALRSWIERIIPAEESAS